jgi:DNA-directed RNA polymerase subunit K/omega
MPVWFAVVLALCIGAVTVALVVAIAAAARAARRAEGALAAVERDLDRDLPPLLGALRELTDELRLVGRSAASEIDRIGQITGRVQEVTDAAAHLLNALSGLTRAGQLVGIAAGVKTGVDVFFHRLRERRGDGHE